MEKSGVAAVEDGAKSLAMNLGNTSAKADYMENHTWQSNFRIDSTEEIPHVNF